MIFKAAPATGPRARVHVGVFLVLVTTVVLAGRATYISQRTQFDVSLRQQIEEIADAKAKQVAAWRTERLGDVAVAVAGALLMPSVRDVMRGADTPEIAEQLRARGSRRYASSTSTSTSCSSIATVGSDWLRVS